jgi:hypothetical protein
MILSEQQEREYRRVLDIEPDFYAGLLYLTLIQLHPGYVPDAIADAILNAYTTMNALGET